MRNQTPNTEGEPDGSLSPTVRRLISMGPRKMDARIMEDYTILYATKDIMRLDVVYVHRIVHQEW